MSGIIYAYVGYLLVTVIFTKVLRVEQLSYQLAKEIP